MFFGAMIRMQEDRQLRFLRKLFLNIVKQQDAACIFIDYIFIPVELFCFRNADADFLFAEAIGNLLHNVDIFLF